jgi:hypothetical protein
VASPWRRKSAGKTIVRNVVTLKGNERFETFSSLVPKVGCWEIFYLFLFEKCLG